MRFSMKAGALRALLAASVAVALPVTAQAPPDVRLALVIGNSAYPAPNTLVNATADARAVEDALKRLGFRTRLLLEADGAGIRAALTQAQAELAGKQAVAALFYAGHGVQQDWRNYLIPVNASFGSPEAVARGGVPVSEVLQAFESAGTRLNVLMLDACRDSPFGGDLATRGLAELHAPSGTLISYATAPGNVAEDGDGHQGHSPYTRALVQELQRPGARLQDVFGRVRLQVREQTGGRQVPALRSNLAEEFRFDTGFSRPPALTHEALLARFEAEKVDWDLIKASPSPADFFAFLRKYPDGFITEMAQFRLDQLQQPGVVPAPLAAGGPAPLASGKWRYVAGDVIEWDVLQGGVFLRKQVNRVTNATAVLVEVNGGDVLWDQMGGIVRNRFGAKDPAVQFAPAEISLGKRWRSAVRNVDGQGRKSSDVWESHAVAVEQVRVPAGTFDAIRVERQGESHKDDGGPPTVMRSTLWIDPATMQWVRQDLLYRREGRVVLDESWRLARVQRAPRS